MSEEDIRNYLSRQSSGTPSPKRVAVRPTGPAPRRRMPAKPPEAETFKKFSASHLLCPRCKQAMPVRERLLLFLPDGDLYDYICTTCGTSVGTKKADR
jgi:hypothetical protein